MSEAGNKSTAFTGALAQPVGFTPAQDLVDLGVECVAVASAQGASAVAGSTVAWVFMVVAAFTVADRRAAGACRSLGHPEHLCEVSL